MQILLTFVLVSVAVAGDLGSTTKSIPAGDIQPGESVSRDNTLHKMLVRQAMSALEKNNSLEFGASCDILKEQERKAYEKMFIGDILLRHILPVKDHGPINENLKNTITELLKIGGPLCNSFKHLECHPNDFGQPVCQCSSSMERVFNFKSMFQRDHDSQTCTIARGEMCAPAEVVSEVNRELAFGAYPEIKLDCAKGTSCIVRSSGVKCDYKALEAELARISKLHNTARSDVAYKLAMAAQGICVCTGAIVQKSVYVLGLSLVVAGIGRCMN